MRHAWRQKDKLNWMPNNFLISALNRNNFKVTRKPSCTTGNKEMKLRDPENMKLFVTNNRG